MSGSIVSARGISKAFGAKTLFANVSLTVSEGDRIGVVGINGTGKSTLLKVLAGKETYDEGIVERRREAKMLYLAQEPEFAPGATPRQLVEEGLGEWTKLRREYDNATPERMAELGEQIELFGGWDRGHEVEDMLYALGVRELDKPVGEMSGGERRRVALAQILVAKPALAVLDEPTNHLDADTIDWLEEYLRDRHEGAVLMVTHDRYVLDAVATRIVELDRGGLFAYDGNYQDFLEQKAVRLEHEQRVESNRQNFLRREVEWLRRQPKARSTKQKARIQRAENALAIDAPKLDERIELQASAQRLGNTILDVEALHVERAGRVLIEDLTLHLAKGERIGIVGKNGAGKTSLLLAVMGELGFRGNVRLGAQTQMAYFDQRRANLNDDWTVFDNVAERENALQTGGIMVNGQPLRTYLETFLFDGQQQRQKVGALSGGERARVTLAKVLKSGANLLLLDEPTNDLDTYTLGALEEMLGGWAGCALVVSHDRYFLNRVCTGILAFEGDGKVVKYQGNYDTYRALREEAKKPVLAPVTATTTAPEKKKKGLSFNEKKELDGLMDRIGEAETRVASLQAGLADPATYASRGGEVPRMQADLETAQAAVTALLERWELLEAKKQ